MKVIICRHADYEGEELTEIGRGQARRLGSKIREEVTGLRVCAHSSTTRRARQTLEIVAKELSITAIGYDTALGADDFDPNLDAIDALIKAVPSQFGAVVLITHRSVMGLVRGYASEYRKRFDFTFSHGDAVVIDTGSKTLTHLMDVSDQTWRIR